MNTFDEIKNLIDGNENILVQGMEVIGIFDKLKFEPHEKITACIFMVKFYFSEILDINLDLNILSGIIFHYAKDWKRYNEMAK